MTTETTTITVDPESELGRAPKHSENSPIILDRNGARFRVTPVSENPWASSDPEKVRARIAEVCEPAYSGGG